MITMKNQTEETTSIIGKRCAEFNEIEACARIIIQKFNPEKIILFGSYACGHPATDSDVDLLIILNTRQSTLKVSSEIALALDHSFPLDIIVKTPQEIHQRLENGDFFIHDIMSKGRVIYERAR